ncbi:MAG: sugar phosphate isomerase/epimerase [Candidatus Odinarchaeota archaeon]|nr:sugar phosphate isomerase/epimerase [Candidatus Odinarchaeota archaeon]
MHIGFTSMYFFELPIDEIFKIANELNFSFIELNSELYCLESSNKSEKMIASEIIDLKNSYNVNLELHAPYVDINLLSYNKEIQKTSWKEILKALHFAYLTEIDIVTLHLGRFPFGLELKQDENSFLKKIYQRGVNYLKNILQFAETHEIKVGVENLHFFPGKFPKYPEDFEMLISDIPDLKITFDLAHAYTISDVLAEELMKRMHDRIINIHVSDVDDITNDHHISIGDGKVDFSLFFKNMKKYKIEAPIVIELDAIKVCGDKISNLRYRKDMLLKSKSKLLNFAKQ